WSGPPRDKKAVAVAAVRRKTAAVNHRSGSHARQRLNLLQQLSEEFRLAAPFLVAGSKQGDPHGQHMVRVEAEVNLVQIDEGLDQQSGSDQKDKSKSEFSTHQKPTQTVAPPACGRTPAALFERLVEVNLGRSESGHESEGDSREDGKNQSKRQNPGMDSGLAKSRRVFWGERLQERNAPR